MMDDAKLTVMAG